MILLDGLIDFLYTILFIMLCCIIPFVFMILLFLIVEFFRGSRFQKRKVKSKYKKRHILLLLFIDFPLAFVRDLYSRNPNAMREHGIYVFCGEQGSGKTISAVQFSRTLKQKYPMIKVRSNISIDWQDGVINDLSDLVFVHNGDIGQIDFIDEIQNSFSSNESKNFPPEMLSEITQERKQHKIIVATSQVFTRMAKPLREQTRYLCLPVTLFGCFTVVRIYRPQLDDTGSMIAKKFVRMYCFVHDNELRNSYNTFEKVKRMTVSGFKPATERRAIWNNAVNSE